MSFGLAATLSTSQKLTPQMQQAIKLLQLSSLELAQEVQAKLDSNPLLERIEEDESYDEDNDYEDSQESLDEPLTLEMWNSDAVVDSINDKENSIDEFDNYDNSDAYDNYDNTDSFDKLQQATIDDSAMDIDSQGLASNSTDSDYNNQETFEISSFNSASASQSATSHFDFDDLDSYQGATNASIQDYVRWQLNFKRLSDTDTMIADYLIDAMDERGFIRLDIEELLQSFATMTSFYQWEEPIERDEIIVMLKVIQSCDQIGRAHV